MKKKKGWLDGREIISFNVEKHGRDFKVVPEELFRDSNGTVHNRWVHDEAEYHTSLTDALIRIKGMEDRMLDK